MPSPRESPPEEAATPACSDRATPPPEADADPDDGRLFNATARNARGAADNHSRQGGRGQQQSSSSCSPCSTPVESRGSQRQGALRSARSTPGDLGCAACGACGARLHPQLQPPPLRSARSSPADVSGGRPQQQQQQQPPPRRPHAGRPASCPEHTTVAPQPTSRPATPTPVGGKEAAWQRQVPLLKSVSHAYIATARLQQQLQQYHLHQPAQSQPDSSGSSRLGGAAPLPCPPPAWRAPGSSLDRPVVLENCTPLPPYRACHCGRIKGGGGGEDSSTVCGTFDGEGITAEGLSWRRLHMSRAKLKATATTSELLSGFAMVAMVELQINEPTKVPEWLFVMFSVCTTVLVAVHIFALMISTYLLPNIDAVSKLQVQELVGESPHERMRGFIELAWAFSTVLGLFLFLVEVAILCWVKFWDYSFTAAWAATVIVVPVLIVFVAFAVHFYHKLVVHKCESSVADIQELEAMKQQLDSATLAHSKV
ncbi:uncharacterized protein LOC126284221 [Schistocerca gregaria]|uniref:uncharacterized protein LOC126284221 n=1 Tax=Schistocerca gregaria TaxID=7010 RepID=UPI00211DC15E|nr:uncharacterized protein LOC126284221 [Schistocerca gregaria]